MRNYLFHLFIIIALFLNLVYAPLCAAQVNDTINLSPRELNIRDDFDKSYDKFNGEQLIVPGAFMLAGAIGAIDSNNNLNKSVHDAMAHLSNGKKCKIDDYVRFLPSVTHLLLGFTGVKSKHNFKERFLISATSHAAMLILGFGTKYMIKEQRPDFSNNRSFPSGHVAMAFTGAELMRMEYGTACGIAGYVVASGVAFLRLYNNKHWLNDVLMGAGVGILSARLGHWLLPFERKLFKINGKEQQRSIITATPYYNINDRAIMVGVNAMF